MVNVLVSFFRFIWIPMFYGHYKYFNYFIAGNDFRRQNQTSMDVWFWHLNTVPALNRIMSLEDIRLKILKIRFSHVRIIMIIWFYILNKPLIQIVVVWMWFVPKIWVGGFENTRPNNDGTTVTLWWDSPERSRSLDWSWRCRTVD